RPPRGGIRFPERQLLGFEIGLFHRDTGPFPGFGLVRARRPPWRHRLQRDFLEIHPSGDPANGRLDRRWSERDLGLFRRRLESPRSRPWDRRRLHEEHVRARKISHPPRGVRSRRIRFPLRRQARYLEEDRRTLGWLPP